jgi:hypothetical protein
MSKHASARWAGLLGLAAALGLSMTIGCSDEPVGHSKSVTKTTEDTPSGRTTTTETREKDTKIIERP